MSTPSSRFYSVNFSRTKHAGENASGWLLYLHIALVGIETFFILVVRLDRLKDLRRHIR